MTMNLITFVTVFGTVLSPVLGGAIMVPGSQNPVCKNLNNLERCFQASPSLAVPYCSSFLAVPAVTVTTTTTPNAHVTLPQTVSTEVDVLTSTTLSTSVSISTSTTTATTYTTTTVFAQQPAVAPVKVKRNPNAPKPPPSTLACLTAVNSKLFTASVSSACSCVIIPPLTVSVTATAATSTITSLTPVTVTTFTTTIVQVVTVVPETSIITAQETDVVTTTSFTTSTTSTVIANPTCTPDALVCPPGSGGACFYRSFLGSGAREPLDIPAAAGVTPDQTTFPGSYTDCEAVDACITFGYLSANNDYTYDIHYLISENVWACTGYYQGDSNAYFTIADSDVGAAYGYYAVS